MATTRRADVEMMLRCDRYCRGPVVLLLIAAGCGTRDHVPESTVDTLATGAVVARNAPAWDVEREEWQILRVVRIGNRDGSGPGTFGRICDVALGPDTLIYILDCLANEVRIFNTDGDHIRTMGGAGEGPGEFQDPYALAFDPQERLWVADETERRYTVFRTNGELVGVFPRPIRWPVTTGVLHFSRDGTLYEHGWWSNGPGGVIRMVVDSSVQVLDTVQLPAWAVHSFGSRVRPQIRRRVPFSPGHIVDVGPNGEMWTGLGDAYRIARIAPEGDTLRIVELTVEAAPLTEPDRLAAQDTVEIATAQGFDVDEARVPTVHPYFTSLVIAENGDLWVRRAIAAAAPSNVRGAAYDIFDPFGRYLSTVRAPVDEFPAPHITEQLLAGVVRDEFDVEYVELYRIQRD